MQFCLLGFLNGSLGQLFQENRTKDNFKALKEPITNTNEEEFGIKVQQVMLNAARHCFQNTGT